MDLTTRAIMLLGLIVALFAIAGVAVAVGRQMNRDNNGEEFDVGRNRTRRRKPPKTKASSKKTAKRDSQSQMAEEPQVMGAPLPPAYPAGNSVESAPPLPPVRASATGPSPFGGAAAPPEEEW